MKNLLFSLLILCIVLNSCDKENIEPISLGYIIAGDSLQSEYIVFNDTIVGLKDIDFNTDGLLDFSLQTSFSAHCASEVWNISAYLLTYSNFEVLIDTNIITGTNADAIISPSKLNEGDYIDKNSNWIDIQDPKFILSTEYIIDSNSDCIQDGVFSFPRWLNNEDGYLGFRAFIDSDTIYGWMRLKVNYWSFPDTVTIVLENICYR